MVELGCHCRKNKRAKARDAAVASDDGPIFSTVAKLVDALERAIPQSRDLKLKKEAL
jgi:hypothetical protein